MIKIGTSDSSPLILTPKLTRPAVYLDYGVIGNLARNAELGQEVRECLLGEGGTLYLSWAHLVELFGLGFGPTYTSFRSYLTSFGRNFVLIDSDARAVINREAEWQPGKQNPVLDEEFLRCLASNWSGMYELDMSTLLDVVTNDENDFVEYQKLHRKHKDSLKKMFDDFRNRYRTDGKWRRQLDNTSYAYTPGTPPTDYIYKQMARECIITHEQIIPSDGLDFEHCIVSLAYCDYVVLDKKWARRCGKIIIPAGAAKVFSSNEVQALIRGIAS